MLVKKHVFYHLPCFSYLRDVPWYEKHSRHFTTWTHLKTFRSHDRQLIENKSCRMFHKTIFEAPSFSMRSLLHVKSSSTWIYIKRFQICGVIEAAVRSALYWLFWNSEYSLYFFRPSNSFLVINRIFTRLHRHPEMMRFKSWPLGQKDGY